MKWAVLGAGSIGCLFATHLVKNAGVIPTLLLRNAQSPLALVRLQTVTGQILETSIPTQGISESSHDNQKFDVVLLTTKSYDTKSALHHVQTNLAEGARVIIMTNGALAVFQELKQTCRPDVRLLLGTTTHGAMRLNPLNILHTGQGQTWLGLLSTPQTVDSVPSEWINVVNCLKATQLGIEWDSQMHRRLWIKLAVNCAINPATALADVPNGALLHSQGLALIRNVCNEIAPVMNFALGANTITSLQLEDEVVRVVRNTARNFSSMHQDVMHGRPSEARYIMGSLLDQAQSANLAAPTVEMLYQLFQLKEQWQNRKS